MSLGLWPDAVPFDPDSGTATHDLRKHFDAAGMPAATLLVCSLDLRGTDWSAQAAIGLARALASVEQRVVLADLDFERPALHALLDAANSEGVADAILFGASLERVTVEPAGEMFGFVPPGAVAPDPAELMADPAWGRLLAEVVSGRGLLLAYAPLGAPGLDALTGQIPSVIVLAEEDEVAATAAMLPETIRVDGVIRPVASEPEVVDEAGPASPAESAPPLDEADVAPVAEPEPAAQTAPPLAAKEEARQALQADIEARLRSVDLPAAESRRRPSARPSAPAPPAEPAWKRAWPWGAIVVALIAGVWLGNAVLGPDDAGSSGVDGASVSAPLGNLLGFSVAIASYEDYDAAMSRADSLSLAAPDVTFYVAPVAFEGATLYRVLAGPLADSVVARAAMQRLVQQGLKIAASEDDVRSTPLGFLVGRYGFRGDAEARMTELEALAVPTYIIEIPSAGDSPAFHVYAGAYSGPTEAAHMRARLRANGVEDTLVLVGRSQP